MNDILTVNRLWLLIRSDFLRNYRSLTITSAAIAVMIFITSMIAGDVSSGFYSSWFGFLLFVYGVHLSSKAFAALHDKNQNQAYLLVPASSVEKTLAELFKVTIGFVFYLLLFIACTSFLVEVIKLVFYGDRHQSFNPFNPYVWEMVAKYLFVQSFFFLGSAWFVKNPLVKTILTLGVIGLGLMLLYWISSQIFYSSFIEHMHLTGIYGRESSGGLDVILPICCWVIAWLRVREAQVSSGI